jgi:hypothetical protein
MWNLPGMLHLCNFLFTEKVSSGRFATNPPPTDWRSRLDQTFGTGYNQPMADAEFQVIKRKIMKFKLFLTVVLLAFLAACTGCGHFANDCGRFIDSDGHFDNSCNFFGPGHESHYDAHYGSRYDTHYGSHCDTH